MRFVLASHNKGKLAEMQAILGELGVEVVMPSDVGVDVDVEETGTTFAENAALKANAIMAASACRLSRMTRDCAWTGFRARRGCIPPGTAGWTATRSAVGCC